jgi:hypothetical protein
MKNTLTSLFIAGTLIGFSLFAAPNTSITPTVVPVAYTDYCSMPPATTYPAGPYECPPGELLYTACVEAAGAKYITAVNDLASDMCDLQLGAEAGNRQCKRVAYEDYQVFQDFEAYNADLAVCQELLDDAMTMIESAYADGVGDATDEFWADVAECCYEE